MKLKVCGMREIENIRGLEKLSPDWMGIIFYEKSPRFPAGLKPEEIQTIDIQKVGVFVKEKTERIKELVAHWGLDFVQLHGDESLEEVRELKSAGLNIIKVFRVSDQLPDDMAKYAPFVDLFLFDTKKSTAYGGTGHKFDWSILKDYNLDIPFLLSGGIEAEDVEAIKEMKLENCVGLDVNSKVEVSPGLKDLEKVKNIKVQL